LAATLLKRNRLRQAVLSNGLPLALPQFRGRSPVVKPTAILCSLALLIAQVFAAPVFAAEDTGANRPRDVYAAIHNHPAVAVQRSRACQALSQVDLARADIKPQLSARLVGGSSLSSHIERRETHVRRFDDREIDGVLTLEQTLYDWGISDAGIGIAEDSRQAALLGIAVEMDRIAADILSIMLSQQELVVVDRLYRGHRQGMTAVIDVIGGKRTVLSYILSPIERAQQIAFRENNRVGKSNPVGKSNLSGSILFAST